MQTDILIENQKEFILGGRAYFTVESAETKNRFTYKINLCKNNKNMFFFHSTKMLVPDFGRFPSCSNDTMWKKRF